MSKLVLLAGFYAGLRSSEIVALTWSDLIFAGEGILLNIAFSKTDRAGVGSVKLLPKNEEKAFAPFTILLVIRSNLPIPLGVFLGSFNVVSLSKHLWVNMLLRLFLRELRHF